MARRRGRPPAGRGGSTPGPWRAGRARRAGSGAPPAGRGG